MPRRRCGCHNRTQHTNDGFTFSVYPRLNHKNQWLQLRLGTYCKSAAGSKLLSKQHRQIPRFRPTSTQIRSHDPKSPFAPPPTLLTRTKSKLYRLHTNSKLPSQHIRTHQLSRAQNQSSPPKRPDSGPHAPVSQRSLAR